MPLTYIRIASNTLTTSAASVTFSSIPGTYTDLVLKVSAKQTGPGPQASMTAVFNSDTSSIYSYTILYGAGSSVGSTRISNNTELSSVFWTSSNYNSGELYIPSYTAAINKPISGITVNEQDSTTANEINISASLFRSTAAITSISLTVPGTSFASGSSFFLYGIKNS